MTISTAGQKWCYSIPQRYVVALLCFFGLFNAFTMRTCLSIAITEMVNKSPAEGTINNDETCTYEMAMVTKNSSSFRIDTNSHKYTDREVYEWSEYTQGLILSSFYWGHIIMQVPGGLIAQKYGAKHIIGFGILITAILTMLTPMAVYSGGSIALIIVRVIMGIGEGVTMPSINVLLVKWAPPDERSRIVSFVYGSAMAGVIFAMIVSGWILQYSSMGWPLVFYTMGSNGIIWYLLWLFLCYNNPQNHPFITQKEENYLEECIGEHTQEAPSPVPWRHILSSKAVYSLILGFVGFGWMYVSMTTHLPKYLSGVLKLSVEYNGYFTSLIFLCTWIGANSTPWLADYFIKKNKYSTTLVRKIFSFIGMTLSPAFAVGASYSGCDRTLIMFIFIVSMTLASCGYPSIMTNTLELSPNYAGTITALANGMSVFTGILAPYVIGILTPNQTLLEWRLVFWIMFVVASGCNVIFLLFGSSEVEYWNDPELVQAEIDQKNRRKTKQPNI